MTEIVKNYIKGPVCGSDMRVTEDGKSIKCVGPRTHCFDISSSGYVNFSGSAGGDSKEAVRARKRFLSLDKYRPAADAVSEILKKYVPTEAVIDTGCGEGYYGSVIASGGNTVIGFDLSRPAVEAAAKRKLQNSFFAVAGINAMPIKDESVYGVTNIFAPCFEDEFSRVLRAGGVLVLVGAGERHLLGLKEAMYDSVTLNEARADMPCGVTLIEKKKLSYEFTLDGSQEINDLFSMTPYYYRTSREAYERLNRLETLTTLAEFDIFVFRKDE